jgi:hypothetical protein
MMWGVWKENKPKDFQEQGKERKDLRKKMGSDSGIPSLSGIMNHSVQTS